MDNISQDFWQILRNLLTQLPSLLTLLICLGVALARWKRHPRVSFVASLAFIFIILHGLFFSTAYIWIPRLIFSGADGANPTFYKALAFVSNALFAVTLATLLLAIFIDRGAPEKSEAGA